MIAGPAGAARRARSRTRGRAPRWFSTRRAAARLAVSALAGALAGCGGGRAVVPAEGEAGRPDPETARPSGNGAGAAAPRSRGAGLDEGGGRSLLASRFRAVGLRIVHDVDLDRDGVSLFVDGFDPARGIGYEYVATEERGVELDDAERARLVSMRGVRILVVDAADAGAVTAVADRFLSGIEPESPAGSPAP